MSVKHASTLRSPVDDFRRSQSIRQPRWQGLAFPDVWLMIAWFALVVIGMVMVTSASMSEAISHDVAPLYYSKRQAIYYVFGFVLAYIVFQVTAFDRPEVHPQIDRMLGDFTSLVVAAYRASDEQDWGSRVKDISREMAHDLENSSIGMGAIGRLSQEAGVTSAFPIVFTSALGVEQAFGGAQGLFRECTGGTSTTPQVWLDHQISDDGRGGVRINWDYVAGLFPRGSHRKRHDLPEGASRLRFGAGVGCPPACGSHRAGA